MTMYRCMCNHLQRLLLFVSSFFGNCFCIHPGRELLYFCIFSVSLVFSLSYFSKIKLQYPLSHFRLLLNAALYNAEITMRLGGCSRVQWTYARTHRHMCICTYIYTEIHKRMKYKTYSLECIFGKYLSSAMWALIFVKCTLNFMKTSCCVSYCTFTFRRQQQSLQGSR